VNGEPGVNRGRIWTYDISPSCRDGSLGRKTLSPFSHPLGMRSWKGGIPMGGHDFFVILFCPAMHPEWDAQ